MVHEVSTLGGTASGLSDRLCLQPPCQSIISASSAIASPVMLSIQHIQRELEERLDAKTAKLIHLQHLIMEYTATLGPEDSRKVRAHCSGTVCKAW